MLTLNPLEIAGVSKKMLRFRDFGDFQCNFPKKFFKNGHLMPV